MTVFLQNNFYCLDSHPHTNGTEIYMVVESCFLLERISHLRRLKRFKCLLVEINLYKNKWLLVGSYNPNLPLINHLAVMKVFGDSYNRVNIVKEPTCFKKTLKTHVVLILFTRIGKINFRIQW